MSLKTKSKGHIGKHSFESLIHGYWSLTKKVKEEVKKGEGSTCPWCGKHINGPQDFKNELSVKEYFISGMCQADQDKFFEA